MYDTTAWRLASLLATFGLIAMYFGAPFLGSIVLSILFLLTSHPSERFKSKLACAVLAFYPLYVFLVELQQWRNGDLGVDFGIFSQVIDQTSKRNLFQTSLISTEWQNFFTHHFSPYLFILGTISQLGIPAELTLLLAHSCSAGALAAGVFSIFRFATLSNSRAAIFTSLILLAPGVRNGMIWETHDEVLALPWIVWSIYAFMRGNLSQATVLLIPCLLFKETAGFTIAPLALWYAVSTKPPKKFQAAALAVVALLFSCLLLFVFPGWLYTPTFTPTSRLGSLTELLSWPVLRDKVLWLLMISLPALPFLALCSKRSFCKSAPFLGAALFSISSIAVTTYGAMYSYTNYYSVVPSVLIMLAITVPVCVHRLSGAAICLGLLLALFAGQSIRLSRHFVAIIKAPSAASELVTLIPFGAPVAVDDYTASVLSTHAQPVRIEHARRSSTKFDYLVYSQKHSGPAQTSKFTDQFKLCHETRRYLVYCSKLQAKGDISQP